MNYPRYLDNVNKIKTRLEKTSLASKRLVIAIGFFAVLLTLIAFEIQPGAGLEVGKSSPENVYAAKDFKYLDLKKTEEKRKEAANRVPEVIVYDEKAASAAISDMRNFFVLLENERAFSTGDIEKIAEEIPEKAKTYIKPETISELLQLSPEDFALVKKIAFQVFAKVVKMKITERNLGEITELYRMKIRDSLSKEFLEPVTLAITESFLRPNSRIDYVETEKRRAEAASRVKPVYTIVRQGQLIVSRGQLVTYEIAEMSKDAGVTRTTVRLMSVSRYAVLLIVILTLSALYLSRFERVYFDSPGLLALLCSIVIFYALVAKLLSYLYFSFSQTLMFFIPVSAVTLMSSILFNSNLAVLVLLICSVVTGIMFGGSFQPAAFAALGGSIPAFIANRKSGRHELREAGLISSAWLGFVALGTSYLSDFRGSIFLSAGAGFLNGAVFSAMTMGILPFLETTFRVTTRQWLLELASPEQELLKELSLKAPGTYSHSIMVANLAEAAAREIGSDPILARVTAYYHDIGKIKRPQFFIENQPPGKNPHEGLKPSLSALVITSHVRDSVEILERNHFPPEIVSITRSHHGTGLVRYFYDRAVEAMSASGEVDKSCFKYKYDLPRGKTAGILLLADSVEAAARTLPRRTPALLESMIDKIIEEKMTGGQLDQSDLTFRDIKKIKVAFLKILSSSYHPRIEYPAVVQLKGESADGSEVNIRNRMGSRKRAKANKKA